MSTAVNQRICLKFCFRNEISCVNALKMLRKTYGDTCMSRTQVYEWYREFRKGRTVVENVPHACRPATSINKQNIEKVKELVLENRNITLRQIAAILQISCGSVHTIMHILDMRRITGSSVIKESRKEQSVLAHAKKIKTEKDVKQNFETSQQEDKTPINC